MLHRFVVVSFLAKNVPERFVSQNWPLRVTLVRPFVSAKPASQILAELRSAIAQRKVVVTEGVSRQMFGEKKDVAVTELTKTRDLLELHKYIISSLMPEFVPPLYEDFRPHVTDQSSGGVRVGERVVISSVSLVEYAGSLRQVVATIPLESVRGVLY